MGSVPLLDVGKSAAAKGEWDGPSEEAAAIHLQATGIDEMLEALEIVNQKTDKASVGAKAGQIEKHPEVSGSAFIFDV